MTVAWTICRREFAAYFATPVGWLCLSSFTAIAGFLFALLTTQFSVQATQVVFNPYAAASLNLHDWLLTPYFANISVILMLLSPALSMRVLAEDRRDGMMDFLLAAPISSVDIVLGKYLAVVGFLTTMLLTTVPCIALLYWLGEPDTGALVSAYTGTLLLASSFAALGVFTSSLTTNQVLALVACTALLLFFWFLGWSENFIGDTLGSILSQLSVLTHSLPMTRGLVHTQDLVYFLSFATFWLYLTILRVESYR